MSVPFSWTRPLSALWYPERTSNSVVLPAPFGPATPRMCPPSTESETPSTATKPPYRALTSVQTSGTRVLRLFSSPISLLEAQPRLLRVRRLDVRRRRDDLVREGAVVARQDLEEQVRIAERRIGDLGRVGEAVVRLIVPEPVAARDAAVDVPLELGHVRREVPRVARDAPGVGEQVDLVVARARVREAGRLAPLRLVALLEGQADRVVHGAEHRRPDGAVRGVPGELEELGHRRAVLQVEERVRRIRRPLLHQRRVVGRVPVRVEDHGRTGLLRLGDHRRPVGDRPARARNRLDADDLPAERGGRLLGALPDVRAVGDIALEDVDRLLRRLEEPLRDQALAEGREDQAVLKLSLVFL